MQSLYNFSDSRPYWWYFPVWTVFFMKKCIIGLTLLTVLMLTVVISDKILLSRNLIRLHVVGHSNSQQDQAVKLELKDALVAYLQPAVVSCETAEEAYRYLHSHLQGITEFSNGFLDAKGYPYSVQVSMGKEPFGIRHYNGFSLPSGVYQSLRIRIGEAEGQNWWCVVFPSLCVPAAGEDFSSTAAGAGFPETLSGSLSGEPEYELEFYLLDCIGKIENFFVFGSE